MQQPLELTFRNMEPSPAIEARVREKAAKLEEFCDEIMSCRIVVESPHRHRHKGKLYHVRIDISVPDGEVVASRDPRDNHAHEDVYVAIRDAFGAARRQLQDYARRRRGRVKHHELLPHGQVCQLYPEEGSGRIETADGRIIYFHRNSVVDGEFDKLEVGSAVRFVEAQGDEGPQASTVHVVATHRTFE